MLEGSILQRLVAAQREGGSAMAGDASTPLNFGVYYKNTLVALCHALEDCILATTDCHPLVMTAFQQGKWYLQEADRYGAIADQAQQVVILASPDTGFHQHATSQRPNVELVDLTPDDPVAQEWHLIILSPRYTAMVLCQELSVADYGPQGRPQHDLERKFYGLWTFDPTLVRQAAAHTIAHVGQYDTDLQTRLATQRDQILAANPDLSEGASAQVVSTAVTRVLDYLQSSETQVQADHTVDLPEDLTQNLTSNEVQALFRMAQLVDRMDPVNPQAATEVTSLLEMMGQLIDLPAWRLRRLRMRAGCTALPVPTRIAAHALSPRLPPGAGGAGAAADAPIAGGGADHHPPNGALGRHGPTGGAGRGSNSPGVAHVGAAQPLSSLGDGPPGAR
jgi:DICT domain-containing protein